MKTMKWTQKLTAALFLALSMFTFTSCDDDEPWDYYNYYEDWYDDYDWYQDPFNYGNSTLNAEAAALRGYWTGMIEYQYYDHGQLQAETMYADFEFDQYDSNSLTDADVRPTMLPPLTTMATIYTTMMATWCTTRKNCALPGTLTPRRATSASSMTTRAMCLPPNGMAASRSAPPTNVSMACLTTMHSDRLLSLT